MSETLHPTPNLPAPTSDNKTQPTRRSWWYWLDFLVLVNLARLRFILLLILIGVVLIYWDTIAGYYRKWTRPAAVSAQPGDEYEWFCPMHPTVVRDNPNELCPICHMPLSRRKKTLHLPEPLPPGVLSRVQLSPYRVILAGIRTWTVDYVRLHKTITTVGYVEFDERSLRQIAARVKGRLDKLLVNQTGQMVHVGDVLALLYSPDLIVTSQNLLDARRSGNDLLYQTARERLRLWGIDDDQIDEILRYGKPLTHLRIRSPIEGHVITRYVKEGQYVEEGTPIFDLADLQTVWIEGQVYETDLAFLPPQEYFHRPEQAERLRLPVLATTLATGDEQFLGFISFIHPHLDANTRTVRVRFELPNPQHKLRPGTSATVQLEVPSYLVPHFQHQLFSNQGLIQALGQCFYAQTTFPLVVGLTGAEFLPAYLSQWAMLQLGYFLAVPETAVIDTGRDKVVYRQIGPGLYEGVSVRLGPRMEDSNGVPYYPVFSGLQPGDLVVTAGSFLLDAETRLNPAAGSIYFGASGTPHSPHDRHQAETSVGTRDEEEATIRANLAQLPTQLDRNLAIKQRYCPIRRNNRLGSMGPPAKMVLEGQPVFLCCPGCESEARSHPQQTLSVVKQLLQHNDRPNSNR